MPPAKKQQRATQLPTDSWIVPLMPCPLVQPPAIRAPKPMQPPPASAAMMRGTMPLPNASRHIAGTVSKAKEPESIAAAKAPTMTPSTSIHSQSMWGVNSR